MKFGQLYKYIWTCMRLIACHIRKLENKIHIKF